MSKSMKEAYNILWWKDAFEAWESRLLWASGVIVVAVLAASFLLALPKWSFRVAALVSAVLMAAHYVCRLAEKVCERRIEERGYTEVELEMWGLA